MDIDDLTGTCVMWFDWTDRRVLPTAAMNTGTAGSHTVPFRVLLKGTSIAGPNRTNPVTPSTSAAWFPMIFVTSTMLPLAGTNPFTHLVQFI
ncbi:MAG: hypothetical protein ABIJ75_01495 [Actinomycetota bacterium]